MEYSTFPTIEMPVSRFVFGTISFIDGDDNASFFKRLDEAYELGVNVLDTAQSYGRDTAEIVLGKYFKERGNRKKFCIITKGCHPSRIRKRVTPFDLEADLTDSLVKLGTEYIDVYLLHRDDTDLPVSIIMDALDKHRREGKIRAYGASNWTHQRLEEANAYAKKAGIAPFVVSSPNYSLAEQYQEPWAPGCITISGPENADAQAWYAANQMPVLAYSSMARGLFSGRFTREMWKDGSSEIDEVCRLAYCGDTNFTRLERCAALAKEKGCSIPQIAIAYILDGAMNVFPIIGALNRAEMESSLSALEVKLTPAEVAWLDLRSDAR